MHLLKRLLEVGAAVPRGAGSSGRVPSAKAIVYTQVSCSCCRRLSSAVALDTCLATPLDCLVLPAARTASPGQGCMQRAASSCLATTVCLLRPRLVPCLTLMCLLAWRYRVFLPSSLRRTT